MFTKTLKTVIAAGLLVAAWDFVTPSRSIRASNAPADQPLVRGIVIHTTPNGAAVIDIALTQTVPYRTLRLSHPERLVVDLKGAREADLRETYPSQSKLIKRVRVSQWKNNPAVVRVVADLAGRPSFKITAQSSGMRIELRSQPPDGDRGNRNTIKTGRQTAHEDSPPKAVFQVHQFKDLSASLTAPALPPHDRLVPITEPRPLKLRHLSASLARISGISIKPAVDGVINVDIASTRSVPYRVFQLAHPFRLVIDVKNARNASRHDVYPVNSQVLKKIRVAQWQREPFPVVRVVADLQGYPIFDVHAQRPGIRIEIRPRNSAPERFRNPFKFKTARIKAPAGTPASGTTPIAEAPAGSRLAPPGNAFSDLKLIGFIDKKDAGTQAVIADGSGLYFVPRGGTFGDTFTVVAISQNGVEVQKLQTAEKTWLIYTPGKSQEATHTGAH